MMRINFLLRSTRNRNRKKIIFVHQTFEICQAKKQVSTMAFTTELQMATTMNEERVSTEVPKEKACSSNKTKQSSSMFPSTHIVRMTVVGIAGIQVDRKYTKNAWRKKTYPRLPNKMRAVVAVSRGQQIKATTPLSKPLSRPQASGSPDKESAAHEESCRHLALWSSEDNSALGSFVEFEVNLDKLDIGDCHQSTSQYIPKSFELIAALTEDTEHERKVALPIGIANLPITGNNSEEVLSLDLPVLSLEQAKPIGNDKNGLMGFQMMSIHDQANQSATANKRKHRGRLLGRSQVEKNQKVPSIADRKLFSSVYSTDSSGDAILRVQIQVIEKAVYETGSSPEEQHDSSTSKTAPTENGPIGPEMGSSEATACTESIGTASLTSDVTPSYENFEQGNLSRLSSRTATDTEEPKASILEVDHETNESVRLRQSSIPKTEPPSNFSKQNERRDNRRVGCFSNFHIPGCGSLSYPDDLTLVTGEIFNWEFRFPVCTSLKTHLDDADTYMFDTKETFHTFSDLERTASRGTVESNDFKDKVGRVLARAEKALGRNEKDTIDDHQRVAGADSLEEIMDGGLSDAPSAPQSKAPVLNPLNVNPTESLEDTHPLDKGNASGPRKEIAIEESSAPTIKKSFAAIFPCTNPSKRCGVERKMAFMPSSTINVPENLEIPETPHDDDLTAITAQEFKLPPKIMQKPISSRFPIPVIFGGSGLCSNTHLVDDGDDTVRGMLLKSRENAIISGSNSLETEVTPPIRENYYEDYDHYSIGRPQSRLSTVPSERKNVI
jgi:hypothetical protein